MFRAFSARPGGEVAKANLEQIDRKKLIIQSEKEEEERIAHYIAEKDFADHQAGAHTRSRSSST
jgi:hypothetical protein